MAKVSKIEWTDATWNPWYGCTKISEGCKNCYAERDMRRFGKDFNTITRSKTTFKDPLTWREPRVIFVCSWGDFFHEDVPKDWRDEAWEIMKHYAGSKHTYLLLTKRPQNIKDMLPVLGWPHGWTNVWLGVSAENQARANERIPKLLDIPATTHFVSIEPLLGAIRLWQSWLPGKCFELDGKPWPSLDWIITGGESGPNHRPCDLDWVRSVRDQCIESGVAFFHKQHGGNRKIDGAWGGRELDGRTWDEFPSQPADVV